VRKSQPGLVVQAARRDGLSLPLLAAIAALLVLQVVRFAI